MIIRNYWLNLLDELGKNNHQKTTTIFNEENVIFYEAIVHLHAGIVLMGKLMI